LTCEFLDLRAGLPECLNDLSSAFPDDAKRGLFVDPWGRPFRFRSLPGDFELGTLGKDGATGGFGENKDYHVRFKQWCADLGIPELPY
jgi:hypothetical protein